MQVGKKFDINNYKDMTYLGAGAFGEVRSAYDKHNRKTVVIKQINKNKASEKMILSEVGALSQLKQYCDKNILCYIDFMEDAQNFYIITEYLGKYITLTKLIYEKKDISDKDLIKLIENLKKGLIDFHNAGVVHRDIKPDNIMVNPKNMDIKYIDFGLACRLDTCYIRETPGTPNYMAPEILLSLLGNATQIPDTLQKWQKADYWSLGMTILEIMLKQPFAEWYITTQMFQHRVDMHSIAEMATDLIETGLSEFVIGKYCQFVFLEKKKLCQYYIDKVQPMLAGTPQNRHL